MGATLSAWLFFRYLFRGDSMLFRVDIETFIEIVINLVPRGFYLTRKVGETQFSTAVFIR